MKTLKILEDVIIPSHPRFNQGDVLGVADELADVLIERGHAEQLIEKKKSKKSLTQPQND